MNIQQKYCGYITIIGKPNVGKSTLLNQIIGEKISIISKKSNTTQKNILGIKTENYYQSIFVDTPGIILNKENNICKTINNSTLIIYVIASVIWNEKDEIILKKIKKNKIPVMIIINKIDKIKNKTILLPFINFLQKKNFFTEIIPICAKKIKSIIFLNKIIKSYLPQNPHIYPKDLITTNSQIFTISEIIREKLIFFLGNELPSILKVGIESIKEKKEKEIYINAIIWVKNTRHKKIIIGCNGEKIKKISIISRHNIEKKFQMNTHLFILVKEY